MWRRCARARSSKGLIDGVARLSEAEIFSLILAPGFSTAREVTDVSGRGVGMDVVRRSVEALRGSIDIASQPGAGLTVTLRLPLTLAIIDGLLVRVGDAHFVLPLANSLECVELTAPGHRGRARQSYRQRARRDHSLHPAQRVFPDGHARAGARADHGGRNRARPLRLRRGPGARRSPDRDQEPGQGCIATFRWFPEPPSSATEPWR